MATIGNLMVMVGANISRLGPALQRGGQHVSSFARTVGSAGTRTRDFGLQAGGAFARVATKAIGMGTALATVAAGGGLAYLIKQEMAAVDATAKLSDQLGVSTEDLIKLRHAAELTGAGAKSMDAGLATMAKRLGEAARGSGAAKPALDELGLSAQRLAAMSPADAFRNIAEGLTRIESPAKRNAIAANLFSKANMKLLNTLSLGRAGLKAAGDETERLGMLYSRLDARSIEAANDAFYRMQRSIGGFITQATIQLGPFIKLFSDDLTEHVTDFSDDIKDSGKSAKSAAVEFGVLGAAIFKTADSFHALRIKGMEAQISTMEFFKSEFSWSLQLADLTSDYHSGLKMSDFETGIKDTKAAITALKAGEKPSKKWAEELREIRKELEGISSNDAGGKLADGLEGAAKAAEKLEKALSKMEDTQRSNGLNKIDAKLFSQSGGKDPFAFQDGLVNARVKATQVHDAQSAYDTHMNKSDRYSDFDKFKFQDIKDAADAFERALDDERLGKLRLSIAGPDASRRIGRILQQQDKNDLADKQKELAKKFTQDGTTPMEKFVKQMVELDHLLDVGAIGERLAGQAAAKYEKSFLSSGKISGSPLVGAAEKGSREAYSTIQRAKFGSLDPREQLRAEAKRQTQHLKRIHAALEEIRDKEPLAVEGRH